MKLISLVAAATLVSASAFAADLPAKTTPRAPVAPAIAAFSWAGPYVGILAGYSTGDVTGVNEYFSPLDAIGPTVVQAGGSYTRSRDDFEGFKGGLYAGYNMQSGNIVYGIEGDIALGDAKQKDTATARVGANSVVLSLQFKEEISGSVRARVGYAMGSFLPFVTAGVAFGQFEAKAVTTSNGVALTSGSDNQTHIGLAVGAGVDYALLSNLILRAEYQYRAYDKQNYGDNATPVKFGLNEHQFRAGLAYKF